MSKFRIGETVVVVSPRVPSMIGTKYVVQGIRESINDGYIILDKKNGNCSGWHEDSLVSEAVYNSNINRAMREED